MAGLVETRLSKEELTDAAVAVVEREVAEALAADEPDSRKGYKALYSIAHELTTEGLIGMKPDGSYHGKENAQKALDAKVKRLLDAEAARPDSRLLRFSSRDQELLPRLDGTRRRLYGQQVAYTTREFFARVTEAADAADRHAADREREFTVLLGRARAAGLVDYDTPRYGGTSIVINLDQLRKLVPLLED